jgi:predicted RNase H-like nuclease (RuvC/YqgF family)
MISHQRSSEISAKVSELKQCKYELTSKIDEINQIKSEINLKSSEIIRLKEETTSQSTIFDHSKRDFDERLRERSEIINDLKNRLSNCEKLIEQNRRERDLLIQ